MAVQQCLIDVVWKRNTSCCSCLVLLQDVPALLAALKAQAVASGQQEQDLAEVVHPRTARVNTLKVSVQQVLKQLKQEGKAGGRAAELARTVKVGAGRDA